MGSKGDIGFNDSLLIPSKKKIKQNASATDILNQNMNHNHNLNNQINDKNTNIPYKPLGIKSIINNHNQMTNQNESMCDLSNHK